MKSADRFAHPILGAIVLAAIGVAVPVRTAQAGLFPLPLQAAQAAEAAEAARVAEAARTDGPAVKALDSAQVPRAGEGAPPAVLATPASPSPALSPKPLDIIRRVDNTHNWIAITFDACATNGQPNGFDRPLFRVLQREHLPATVFTSGRWVEFHPAAMKELVAEPLIEFANHSYDHPHMNRLSADEIAVELDRTEAALGLYGRQSVAFRPPFGEFNDRVLEVARDKQIPAVLWDVVSGDPSAGVTADGLIRTVVRKTRAGSIIIFHINGRAAQTAAALPAILRQLRARGFEFVHLSTLLSSGPSPGGVVSAASGPAGDGEDNAIMPPTLASPADDAEATEAPVAAPPALSPLGQPAPPPISPPSVTR